MVMDAVLIKRDSQEVANFESYFQLYYLPLHNFIGRVLKDRAKAEDLVQESFLRLHRQLHWSYTPDNVWSWLYRVAINLCRDHWRSSIYQHEYGIITCESLKKDNRPPVIDLYEWLETRAELQELVDELPFNYKEIIRFRFYQDLRLKEIADEVDCPIGTVKSRLFYALRLLKQKIVENRRAAYELYHFSRG